MVRSPSPLLKCHFSWPIPGLRHYCLFSQRVSFASPCPLRHSLMEHCTPHLGSITPLLPFRCTRFPPLLVFLLVAMPTVADVTLAVSTFQVPRAPLQYSKQGKLVSPLSPMRATYPAKYTRNMPALVVLICMCVRLTAATRLLHLHIGWTINKCPARVENL